MRVPVPAIVSFFAFGFVAACSSSGGGGPNLIASEVDFSVAPGASFTGAPITPAVKVEVKDANGAKVTTSSASVTLSLIGAGTLGGTTTRNAAAGVATFTDLTLTPAGNYQLIAASGTLAKDTTAPFAVTDPPPAPDSIEVLVGNAAGGAVFKSQQNSSQNPAVDEVAIGGKVHWTWVGGTHNVSPNGVPAIAPSATSAPPFSYELVFNTAGTYQYICTVHGGNMKGSIVVR
jgi:plastocyanin